MAGGGASTDRSPVWFWIATTCAGFAIALVAVAATLDATVEHYGFWSGAPMVAAYVATAFTLIFLAPAAGWIRRRFPRPSKDADHCIPTPTTTAEAHELLFDQLSQVEKLLTDGRFPYHLDDRGGELERVRRDLIKVERTVRLKLVQSGEKDFDTQVQKLISDLGVLAGQVMTIRSSPLWRIRQRHFSVSLDRRRNECIELARQLEDFVNPYAPEAEVEG